MPQRRNHRSTRVLAVIAVAGWTSGCTDGYPTQDEQRPDPWTMSQDERVEALNELGFDAYPRRRWRYDLRPGCVLEVEHRREDAPPLVLQFRLGEARLAVVRDVPDRAYDLRVRPRGAAGAAERSLLESRRWSDTIRAQRIAEAIAADCGAVRHAPR
jgi:hypothetical protein